MIHSKDRQLPYMDFLERARELQALAKWDECIAKCEKAIECLGVHPSSDWIASRLLLGNAVVVSELDGKIELAIERVREALIEIDPTEQKKRAQSHRILGYLFQRRENGIRSANLTFSVEHFKEAYCYFKTEEDQAPAAYLLVEIAMTIRERLAAFAEEKIKVRDDLDYQYRRAEVQEGIRHLSDALAIFTKDAYPEEFEDVSASLKSFESLFNELPEDG